MVTLNRQAFELLIPKSWAVKMGAGQMTYLQKLKRNKKLFYLSCLSSSLIFATMAGVYLYQFWPGLPYFLMGLSVLITVSVLLIFPSGWKLVKEYQQYKRHA